MSSSHLELPSKTNEPLRLLRLPAVRQRTGKCRSDIYRGIARGTFPAPVKLGARASAWNAAEVDAWIAARIAERDARGAA
jgi:prophage regulatory protein